MGNMKEQKKHLLAIIPARGGSKGLPNKNIKVLNGKPLINYTVEAALGAGIFDKVIVSTDSQNIADAAQAAGAEIPFLRPAEYATDEAGSLEVIKHAIKFLQDKEEHFDIVCLLQPTSPLRNSRHIKEAYALLREKDAKSLISVCECEHSPLWSNTIGEDLRMDSFIRSEVMGKRRQELPQYYRINGALYFSCTEAFLERKGFFGPDSIAYKMGISESLDIDTADDFYYAEYLLEKNINKQADNPIYKTKG